MSNQQLTPHATSASSGTGVGPKAAAQTAERHYTTGLTRENIERALTQAGKNPHRLSPADLVPLEDFHSLGRIATVQLIQLAGVSAADRVLDAGTGIGGAARLLAAETGCHVTAVDVTAEYCETADWLNTATGLNSHIEVRRADVTELPFADGTFDVVISQHVQMNVADKSRLYGEARRVLTPGGRLALWDVTAGPQEPIRFPLPWATDPRDSHLITPADLRDVTSRAGFEITAWNDVTDVARPKPCARSSPHRQTRSACTSSSPTSRPRQRTSSPTPSRTASA